MEIQASEQTQNPVELVDNTTNSTAEVSITPTPEVTTAPTTNANENFLWCSQKWCVLFSLCNCFELKPLKFMLLVNALNKVVTTDITMSHVNHSLNSLIHFFLQVMPGKMLGTEQ